MQEQVSFSAKEKIESVLSLTASIFKLGLFISQDCDFVPDLIRSGFMWRVLQFLQFSMQRDMLSYFN